MVTWSEIQVRRLLELDADETELNTKFESVAQRDKRFQELESRLVQEQRHHLTELREVHLRPALCRLESTLTEVLVRNGFVQVVTPTIMSRGLLEKMSIGADHPLGAQIFWLDRDRCLRPMLAPHLYYVLKDLLRLWESPVRIFEVGSCFRKESQGSQHSNEFTMLNLAEMGVTEESRQARIEELAALITEAAGIKEYRLESQKSVVYGETIDIVAGDQGLEVGSAAMGPHPLDRAWRISVPWVGIGFGLERLLMIANGGRSLSRMARSLTYLDGVRLNI
jgi:phenylalanyl-tRNA synthetase alpha chain